MALLAAVPGVIDYLYTVPPRSTGKRRATRHAIVNLSAIALFALAWWLRGLEVNQMKLVRVDERRIVLGRTEKGYVAFDDHFTHRGGSLADGSMICGTVQCPWHGSQFDVQTGAVRAGPAEEGIRTYRVEESGDEVRFIL